MFTSMRGLLFLFLLPLSLLANIGSIVSYKGDVSVMRGDKTLIVTQKGFTIEEKDVINASKKSRAQIRFKDQTVITVGANSVLKVEQFLFGNAQNSKAEFGMLKGAFRSITGKIGKMSPKKFNLKTPTATIGIRGSQGITVVGDQETEHFTTEGLYLMALNPSSVTVASNHLTTPLNQHTISDIQTNELLLIAQAVSRPAPIPAGSVGKAQVGAPQINVRPFNPQELDSAIDQAGGGAPVMTPDQIIEGDTGTEGDSTAQESTTQDESDENDEGTQEQGAESDEKESSSGSADEGGESLGEGSDNTETTSSDDPFGGDSTTPSSEEAPSTQTSSDQLGGNLDQTEGEIASQKKVQNEAVAEQQTKEEIQKSADEIEQPTTDNNKFHPEGGDGDTTSLQQVAYPDSDPAVSWGFWLSEGNTVSDAQSNPNAIEDTFVSGDVTPSNVIKSYIEQNKHATYKGGVIGTVNNSGTNEIMSNGNVELNFHFGSPQAVDGNIEFDAGSDHWNIKVGGGKIGTNNFDLNDFSSGDSSTVNVQSGSGSGNFYGSQGSSIGGKFSAGSGATVDTSAKKAVGSFIAKEQ